jgi:hypothetical protein
MSESTAAQPDPPPAAAKAAEDLPPVDQAVWIVEERQVRGHALLYKPLAVRMNVALVMVSPKGTYRVALPDSQPTWAS